MQTPNLTANEKKMLENIAGNDFSNEPTDPVWSDCLADGPHGAFVSPKAFGGIVASLVQKGLARCNGESVALTEGGAAAAGTEQPQARTEDPNALHWRNRISLAEPEDSHSYGLITDWELGCAALYKQGEISLEKYDARTQGDPFGEKWRARAA